MDQSEKLSFSESGLTRETAGIIYYSLAADDSHSFGRRHSEVKEHPHTSPVYSLVHALARACISLCGARSRTAASLGVERLSSPRS